MSDEEWELIADAAYQGGNFTATWSRDVLVSTALRLRKQRYLMD